MKYTINFSSYFIAKELRKRGYSVTPHYDLDLLLIEKDGRSMYTHASITVQQTSSFLLCRDKFLSKEVLLRGGFPTARGAVITKDSIEEVSKLRFPLAVKPLNLSGGVGIALNLRSVEEVAEYFSGHPDYEAVLAEEMLRGQDTRILIVRGKFFAACQRDPASVIGDGSHTLEELIRSENERREKILHRQHTEGVIDEDIFPILFDVDLTRFIEQIGHTLGYVPVEGQRVFVRPNANVGSGGTSIDVTDTICSENRRLCEEVAKALKMTTVGIDLLIDDLSRPIQEQPGCGIVEVNASPGLSLHILTQIGQHHDPTPLIVDEIEEYLEKQTA
jgi:cyanophycin synthetase